MAVIFRGLRSKLPVTIRTVGFGSEWSWGTYENRRYSGCVLQHDTDVLPSAPATPDPAGAFVSKIVASSILSATTFRSHQQASLHGIDD